MPHCGPHAARVRLLSQIEYSLCEIMGAHYMVELDDIVDAFTDYRIKQPALLRRIAAPLRRRTA